MTTVFVIAGFDLKDTATTKYAVLLGGLKKKGYNVVPVDISWRYTTPSQFTNKFIHLYEQRKTDKNIIIGNSFGAVVALLASAQVSPEEVYLCSLSPFFKEDRGKRPDDYAIDIFGLRRAQDLWSIEFNQLARQLNASKTKTTITYGELEHQTSPVLVARCVEAGKRIKNSKLIELSDTPHSMKDERYMKHLLKLL